MRFAIAAVDRYMGVFEAFVQAGWQPLKLFTVPMQDELGNQRATIAYAERNKVSVQLLPITEDDLRDLREQGCEALIVASYDWKIPDWRPYLKYAVNFHPSPLPEGRGPYPPPRAILEGRKSWGVSCYRITSEVDKGDVLAVETFPLQPDECHESIDLKIQMAARKLAAAVAAQFGELWENAVPQQDSSYWQKYKLSERVIDFTWPVEKILLYIRAFGATRSIAQVGNDWLLVKRGVGWVEEHNDIPGSIVHVFNRTIIVAAADGYIGILESDPAPVQVVAEVQAEMDIAS